MARTLLRSDIVCFLALTGTGGLRGKPAGTISTRWSQSPPTSSTSASARAGGDRRGQRQDAILAFRPASNVTLVAACRTGGCELELQIWLQ